MRRGTTGERRLRRGRIPGFVRGVVRRARLPLVVMAACLAIFGVVEVAFSDDSGITITTPADTAQYGRGDTINADYSCLDPATGAQVADCHGTVDNGSPIDTGALGDHSFTVDSTIAVGQAASKTVHYTVVDATPPTVTLTTPSDGLIVTQGTSVNASYS